MYIALEGSGVLELESGEHFPLERDSLIRVGPAERRRVLAGPDGVRTLVVGAIPGRASEPRHRTVLGAPDPMAGRRGGWHEGRAPRSLVGAYVARNGSGSAHRRLNALLSARVALSVSQNSTDSLTFAVAEEFPGALVFDHCA